MNTSLYILLLDIQQYTSNVYLFIYSELAQIRAMNVWLSPSKKSRRKYMRKSKRDSLKIETMLLNVKKSFAKVSLTSFSLLKSWLEYLRLFEFLLIVWIILISGIWSNSPRATQQVPNATRSSDGRNQERRGQEKIETSYHYHRRLMSI